MTFYRYDYYVLHKPQCYDFTLLEKIKVGLYYYWRRKNKVWGKNVWFSVLSTWKAFTTTITKSCPTRWGQLHGLDNTIVSYRKP